MEEKKFNMTKRIIIMCISILALLVVAMLGTYAAASIEMAPTGPQLIKSGTLSINYGDTIGGAITASKPLTDGEGMDQDPYVITVENTGTLPVSYTVKIKEDTATIAGLDTTNLLAKDNIRFSYRKVGGEYSAPKSLGELQDGLVTTGKLQNEGQTVQYEIKIWVDSNLGNNAIGKTFYGKIIVEATQVQGIVIKQVVAGGSNTFAITEDGQVYGWGSNYSGSLGDGTSGNGTDKTVPTLIESISNLNVKQISAGGHTIALTNDGQVYGWGLNLYGQIGDGTIGIANNKTVPTLISGINNVKQVAAGNLHTVAVTENGDVYAWGYNSHGQIGDGTITAGANGKTTPTLIEGIKNVKQVAAGVYHTIAVTEEGSVYTWGTNGSGQLGDGTIGVANDKKVPTKINGISNVKQIAAGESYTVAVTEEGNVYTWGANEYGQLGYGASGYGTEKTVPTKINGISNVKEIAAGARYIVALTEDGRVYAWGYNEYGQLGDGTYEDKNVPTLIEGINNVKQIVSGGYHTVAVTEAGKVYTWGDNSVGQLGDGTYEDKNVPTLITFNKN